MGLSKVMWQTKTVISWNQNVYGYQIRQDRNLPRRTPSHKITWQFDQVVL